MTQYHNTNTVYIYVYIGLYTVYIHAFRKPGLDIEVRAGAPSWGRSWTGWGWRTAAARGPAWRSGCASDSRSPPTDTARASPSPSPPEDTRSQKCQAGLDTKRPQLCSSMFSLTTSESHTFYIVYIPFLQHEGYSHFWSNMTQFFYLKKNTASN